MAAKVRVTGDLNFEFEVKFNQDKNILIEAKIAVDAGKDKVYVATGNIEDINLKALSFITSRITYYLKKMGASTEIPLGVREDKNSITERLIEKGLGYLIDARYGSSDAINKMLSEKNFILNASWIEFYIRKFHIHKTENK